MAKKKGKANKITKKKTVKVPKRKLIKKHIKKIITKVKSKVSSLKRIAPPNLVLKSKKEECEIKEKVAPKQFEVITPDGVDIKLNFYGRLDSD